MYTPKYKISFASKVKCVVSEEKDILLSLASLAELRNFIPNIDTKTNFDLLPISFSAAVVGRVNKNDDVIDTQTALAVYRNFIHKPIDIEHKVRAACGVILTAGFSEFGTEKPLTEEEVKNLQTPFNITLGGVIWKRVAPEIADLIEESNDPSSDDYLSVSTSWELGFSDYSIVSLNEGQKNIFGGQLESNAVEVEKLSKYLKCNGGTGKIGDKRIYRMPSTNVVPLGIGITEKPAADVKGISISTQDINNNVIVDSDAKLKVVTDKKITDVAEKTNTLENDKNIKVEDTKAALTGTPDYSFYFCPTCMKTPNKHLTINDFGNVSCPNCHTTSPSAEWKPSNSPKPANQMSPTVAPASIQNTEDKNNISQSQNNNVKIERNMSIKTIADLTDENLKVANAATIAELVSNEIKKGNDTWLAEKNQLVANKDLVEKELAKASEENKKTLEELKKVQANVDLLNKEKADREAVEKFNARMNQVTEAYELDDEQKAVIVSDIKELASDEDFAKWEAKAKVLFKPFKKKGKDDTSKNDADKNDKGNTDDKNKNDNSSNASVIDKALDNAKKEAVTIANSATTQPQSLKEKYQAAFAMENFIIKNK